MTQEDNRKYIKKDDAVSETIGFIYIFAIVILSMSLIYAMGYPALQSSMDASIFESAEQSFIVLQSNMKMVAFNQAPVKNLKIKLHSSTLSITSNSNITIEYTGGVLSYPTGEIEYRKGDRVLTYENTGVWKTYPSGRIMVSRPQIYTSTMNNTNITTITIITINGNTSAGGSSIATLSMKHNTTSITTSTTLTNVTLKINSTYAPQWADYLESIDFNIINSTDSSLTARRNQTLLVVGQHVVDVEIT